MTLYLAKESRKLRPTVLTLLLAVTVIPAFIVWPNWPHRALRFMGDSESHQTLEDLQTSSKSAGGKEVKTILLWTTFWGGTNFYFLDAPEDCRHSYECSVSRNRSLASGADAILFHPVDMRGNDLPETRQARQRYVFYSMEPPTLRFGHPPGGKQFPNQTEPFWNWTMTYRLNSDIIALWTTGYANGKNGYKGDRWDMKEFMKNKSKNAVWLVSNCETPGNREKIVADLRKHIDVDEFGKCSGKMCPGDKQLRVRSQGCEEYVMKTYYFHLSLENSDCEHWVTEKLWRPVNGWMVPIVLNRTVTKGFLPESAYIAVNDFKTVADLATYMKSLLNDTSKLESYFEWRYQEMAPASIREELKHDSGLCALCRKLHEDTSVKSYPYDLKPWIGRSCRH